MKRREYDISITVNDVQINKVIIDPHYELKHAESVTDEIIIELVKTLDGEEAEPSSIDKPFTYYVRDHIEYQGNLYKLIWLVEDHQIYIGVVNAYRR